VHAGIKKLIAAAVVMAAVVLCSGPGRQLPAVVTVAVNGNPLKIPQAFFPSWGRMRPGEVETDALALSASWPTMSPFVEPDDDDERPVYVSHYKLLGILIDPAGSNTASAQHGFLRRLSKEWLEDRIPAGERFGLLRFVYKDIEQFKRTGNDAYGGKDLYLAPSLEEPETLITCSPEFEPDPDSEQATQMRQAGEFVKNPGCDQDFFVPGMQNVRVKVHYFRAHLKDWKRIQASVVQLLQSFQVQPAPSTPPS
jgi:hypothetical protein